MKRVIFSILLISLLVLSGCETLETPVATPTPLASCAEGQNADSSQTCSLGEETSPAQTSAASQGVSTQVEIKYAKNFTLEYKDGYKKLTILQPWANASQAYTYILIPRGSQPPSDAGSAMIIETPVRSIVTLSSTYFTFLENIGELGSLKGIDDATYVYNPTVRSMADSGALTIVGGGASLGAVDLEKLIALKPELIMTSASGSPDVDVHPKLIMAGLPVVINSDYLENSPLGRAEWGKFIAAFYDKEDLAGRLFDEMVGRYEALKMKVSILSFRPTVFTNTDYQGTWYVADGQSYSAQLLHDAGAAYLWADLPGTGSSPLSFEEVFSRAKDADFWLNVGFATDLQGLAGMDSRYTEFKAFKDQKVFNYTARSNVNGGLDYYESGVANPDVVLQDLVKIFHPELLPDVQLFYYQALK